ncbi:MAG: endonuclease III domain-containing protein [Candidatus Omnitrophica bacterium]|nr:endonuclease III domain-containing protein [Candidatus Omnitrophota bacterium]
MKRRLLGLYRRMLKRFGPQYWWPADSDLEVVVGVVLTQNTSWSNVEKAIGNLKRQGLLSCRKLQAAPRRKLARAIRPAGYFNIKTKRLKNFISHLKKNYAGSLSRMLDKDTASLRRELLSINGIGPESADSIILYAARKPVFVVDAYTRRLMSREGFIKEGAEYDEVQRLFMDNLPHDVDLFKEFHALIVRLAKEHCRKNNPRCDVCPVKR